MAASSEADAYARDGFCVIPGLHSPAVAAGAKEKLALLPGSRSDPSGVKVWMLDQLPDILRPLMTAPATLEALAALIGPEIEFLSVKTVFKDKAVDFPSPWHHDWFYWGGAPKISIWIALDEAREDNGCLRVIPGSHLKDFPLSKVETGKGFGNRIADAAVQGLPIRSLPARPGDAIFFHDRLVHSSHPNRLGQDRWSLISTYRNAAIPDSSTEWKSSLRLSPPGAPQGPGAGPRERRRQP